MHAEDYTSAILNATFESKAWATRFSLVVNPVATSLRHKNNLQRAICAGNVSSVEIPICLDLTLVHQVRRKIICDYNLAVVREERIFVCGFALKHESFFFRILTEAAAAGKLFCAWHCKAARVLYTQYMKRRNIIVCSLSRSLAAATKA